MKSLEVTVTVSSDGQLSINPPLDIPTGAYKKAIIDIKTLTLIEGQLKPRTLGLIVEWAALHQVELMHNWNFARQQQTLESIDPLE